MVCLEALSAGSMPVHSVAGVYVLFKNGQAVEVSTSTWSCHLGAAERLRKDRRHVDFTHWNFVPIADEPTRKAEAARLKEAAGLV